MYVHIYICIYFYHCWVYTSSYCSGNHRRRLHRSLWRWFQRTKLWGRANKQHRSTSNIPMFLNAKHFHHYKNGKFSFYVSNGSETIRTCWNKVHRFHRHKLARISTDGPSPQAKKLANQCCSRAASLNVRGLNKNTKREIILNIMRRNHYDIMLLSETC